MNDRRSNHNGDDIASRRGFRGRDRSSLHPPPEEGSIWEGTIQRIQPYGAFCSFGPLSGRESQRQRRPWQGLIHISKLSETRVEKVEDVVDIADAVWVKVLEVEKQGPSNPSRETDQHMSVRYRIKLSMKDVSQDGTGQDLGREREAKEQVTTQLETNLNSMIGMGVALDPMERLVLKNNGRYGSGSNSCLSSRKTTFRGGYTLVGDDEGEPQPDPSTSVASGTDKSSYRTAPMGRGRGATLPAWMTSTEGPVGVSQGEKIASDGKSDNDKYGDPGDDDDSSQRRLSSKAKERRDRRKHKKKSRHRHKRRKRTHDYSGDESSDTSLSGHRSNYDDGRRRRKRHKSSSRSRRRRDSRNSSSKKKDKKKRKLSHHNEKDDDYRISRSLRYKSDESSCDNASVSDSCSSYSSR